MSVWRQKAIACLPELKKEIELSETTIYGVFFSLLPAVVNAHRANDVERLARIYDYAEWCFKQDQKDLWNAAGVGFYEHLGDHVETLESISQWVKPDVYKEIRELLKLRIDEQKLKEIDRKYSSGSNQRTL